MIGVETQRRCPTGESYSGFGPSMGSEDLPYCLSFLYHSGGVMT